MMHRPGAFPPQRTAMTRVYEGAVLGMALGLAAVGAMAFLSGTIISTLRHGWRWAPWLPSRRRRSAPSSAGCTWFVKTYKPCLRNYGRYDGIVTSISNRLSRTC